jgi:hypothetical protein
MNNMGQLKEIIGFMNANLKHNKDFQTSNSKSEADQILANLGAVEVIDKSEEGKSFYRKVAM